ncbi:hypothetical protein E2C01_063988 [Portunus trituberculatus]|uniref:Uncharacterized protein n=1 Tax=Portunus trituberculatus TaxID=210409 RepID=A0A5B7HKI6_PORTR|nr:hypothetical protein [Portunus trituberculatus]
MNGSKVRHTIGSSDIDEQYCKYLGEEGDTIRGLHTTPIMSYVDKLNFTLTYASGGTCQVKVSFYIVFLGSICDASVCMCLCVIYSSSADLVTQPAISIQKELLG